MAIEESTIHLYWVTGGSQIFFNVKAIVKEMKVFQVVNQ